MHLMVFVESIALVIRLWAVRGFLLLLAALSRVLRWVVYDLGKDISTIDA